MQKASTNVGLRRPALRRPKLENVEAAEAEKEAAIRAGTAISIAKIMNSRNSSSPTILSESEELSKTVIISDNAQGTLSHSGSSNSLRLDSVNDFSDSEDFGRCSSVRTEVIVEQEKAKRVRREKRCPDYPGLAFGAPLGFGSDTMMKFNIINNELHNIMRSQLKRVDGEATALANRIKEFDANLEKSEQLIKTATTALAETVALEMERKRLKKENNETDSDCDESDPLSQFDLQLALLDGKLLQVKQMASHEPTLKASELLENRTKDKFSSPSRESNQKEEHDGIVNAAQNKSNEDLHSTATNILVNGDHKELIKTESCHNLTHKADKETTW